MSIPVVLSFIDDCVFVWFKIKTSVKVAKVVWLQPGLFELNSLLSTLVLDKL